MRTSIHIFPFIFAFLLVASSSFADIEVISDSQNELKLLVTTKNWSEDHVEASKVLLPENAGVDDRIGGLQVPYFRRLIGLPSNNLPTVSISRQTWSEPVSFSLPEGNVSHENDRIPPLSTVGTVFVGAPFKWRGRWVSDLYIVPMKYSGSSISKLNELEVTVHYPPKTEGLVSDNDQLANDFLINSQTASRWALTKDKASSALIGWPEGMTYRIELQHDGMYEISREFLESHGIYLEGSDPRHFRIFGNGGFMIPELFREERKSQLTENAILVEGEEDGSWDEGDRIIFYGRSVNSWETTWAEGDYRHASNPYTRKNVYYLNISEDGTPGKRMESLESTSSPTYSENISRSRLYNENDNFIFYKNGHRETGKKWFAAEVMPGSQYTSTFRLDAPVLEDSILVWVSSAQLSGRGQGNIYINNILARNFDLSSSVFSFHFPASELRNGSNTFTYEIPSNSRSGGLFDWYEIIYDRELTTTHGIIRFDQFSTLGVAQIRLSGLNNPWIFNIEDYANVKYTTRNPFTIDVNPAFPEQFIAVSAENMMTPELAIEDIIGYGEYPDGLRNTNISADYIYIVHEDFWAASAALEEFVENRDDVEVVRVRIDDVFREFGWGLFDPIAIRDFLYYAQNNWQSGRKGNPSVCLLIGDGDYDYRNIEFSGDKNWIPPYENLQICRDDFYAEFGTEYPQYIMGRLPFQNSSQFENYLDGLFEYNNNTNRGPWQSRVILVADDEFVETGPTPLDQDHIEDTESLATNIMPSYMDLQKIYVGTYPTNYDPTNGARIKPLATRNLLETINEGALLVNYMGHGNAHVWAHEQLFLDTRDKFLVNSGYKRPVYFAATCSWGHYDRPNNEAFFELLMGQNGGPIGVIAASRNTSGGSNRGLSNAYYTCLFDRERTPRIGECLLIAKMNSGGLTNLYYHCFGDPMMPLALPEKDIQVTTNDLEMVPMEKTQFEAEIRNQDNDQVDNTFQGDALVTVIGGFRRWEYTFTERNNNGELVQGGTTYYKMPLGLLFRGYTSVVNGEINPQFIVPRDADYGSDDAVIQIYASEEESQGIGAMTQIHIAEGSGELNDNTPPQIEIYFDHRNWQDGDLTSLRPLLIIDAFDSSGINLTGEIGHEIKINIDGGAQELTITDEFTYVRDSYVKGSAERILYDLEPGLHHMESWVWDNANNLSRSSVSFSVVDTENLENDNFYIRNIYNAPNPFRDETHFTFEGSGIQNAKIKIFTPSGRHIKTIETDFSDDQSFYYVPWDGKDQYDDTVANGVYLYKLFVEGPNGLKAEEIGKAMKVR